MKCIFIAGEAKEYHSSDSIEESEDGQTDSYNPITSEFLNSLTTSGIPSHN